MYRSVSWSRVSDGMHATQKPVRTTSLSMDGTELLGFDPTIEEEIAKKERSRTKFAENAVHLIPFVLLFCAFVLWLFSNPNVEVGLKAADSAAAKIDGLRVEGGFDTESSDATQTDVLPGELEDDAPRGTKDVKITNKASRKLAQTFR